MKGRKKSFGIVLTVLAALIIVGVIVGLSVRHNKKQQQGHSATIVQNMVTATPTPDGIYIVDAPDWVAQGGSYQGQTGSNQDQNVPAGITIVDTPSWAYNSTPAQNSTTSGGIYVVETPNPGGMYIIETPNPGGMYVIETPTPGGGGSGGGGGGGKPTGTTIASGSFSSSTGVGLNITVTYNAVVSGPSAVDVTMSASLSHGTLSSQSTSVSFTCAGQSGSVSAPSINGSGTTYLGSRTFTVNVPSGTSQTCNMSASWLFNGTYSGQQIGSVQANTAITLSR